MSEAIAAQVARVHELLAARGATVAPAESLTAGLLTAALTEPPGASATVRGGVVVYATELKVTLAAVPEALLADRGPVDPDVALAMAAGVRTRLSADYGVALTGVAGPDEQGSIPVGTVFVAVAGPEESQVEGHRIGGDRADVRAGAVDAALELLTAVLAAPNPRSP